MGSHELIWKRKEYEFNIIIYWATMFRPTIMPICCLLPTRYFSLSCLKKTPPSLLSIAQSRPWTLAGNKQNRYPMSSSSIICYQFYSNAHCIYMVVLVLQWLYGTILNSTWSKLDRTPRIDQGVISRETRYNQIITFQMKDRHTSRPSPPAIEWGGGDARPPIQWEVCFCHYKSFLY